jgi:hypothetical protein
MTPIRSILGAVAFGLVLAAGASAQQVEVRGRGDADNDAFLRRLVESGEYRLIARDTLLTATDTVHGTALVVGATVRIDGVITGDLVIVDANVFLRPNARILGSVRNIAGGYYPSDHAVIQGGLRTEPNADYRVREEAGGARLVILGIAQPGVIVRPGIFGFAVPTYDRVDGLTLSYGSGVLLPRMGRVEPVINGRIDYRSQRGAITGGLELELPRGATTLAIGAERTTVTNERWIRGDLDNTISFFFMAKDLRDYYAADRAYAELRRIIESGPRTTTLRLRAQVEDATSLRAGTPWTVTGTPRADNLPVDEGRISSLIGGGRMEWDLPQHRVRVDGLVEGASPRALDGDHEFARFVLSGDWAMNAFSNQTLRIQPHLQGPLPGTDWLPRQRWSFVGGSGTLNTFEIAEFRGDRVAFVETTYIIPVPYRVRFLGTPDLELLHAAGMAWTANDARSLEQNVGARIRFGLVNVRLLMNPAASGDQTRFKFSAGLNLPRRAYAWEREAAR